MRIFCLNCLRSVSSELPDDAVIRAACVCPECLAGGVVTVTPDPLPLRTLLNDGPEITAEEFDRIQVISMKLKIIFQRDGFKPEGFEDYLVRAVWEASQP